MPEEVAEFDMSRTLDDIRSELSGLHEQSRSLNGILDRLHSENERLRHAETRQTVQPTIRELIKLADDWRSRATALGDQPELARLCGEVVDDVTMILDRQGVAEFGVDQECKFDRHVHRAVGTQLTDNVELTGLVALARRPGYQENDRVIRFAEVVVYKFVATEPPVETTEENDD